MMMTMKMVSTFIILYRALYLCVMYMGDKGVRVLSQEVK